MIDDLLKTLKKASEANEELYEELSRISQECYKNGSNEAADYYLRMAIAVLALFLDIDNEIKKLEES